MNCNNQAIQPPKPALTEHSTSNLVSPSRLVEIEDDDDIKTTMITMKTMQEKSDGVNNVEAETAQTLNPFHSRSALTCANNLSFFHTGVKRKISVEIR